MSKGNLVQFMVNVSKSNSPVYRVGQRMSVYHPHGCLYRYFIPEGHNMVEVTEEAFKGMREKMEC